MDNDFSNPTILCKKLLFVEKYHGFALNVESFSMRFESYISEAIQISFLRCARVHSVRLHADALQL